MLTWAITRAGYDLPAFIEKFPKVQKWLDGETKPTVKQLEKFSRKVYLPFGYLFLPKPPREELPIPYFRSNNSETNKIHINVYDTILLLQQRQDWLREYLKNNDFHPLPFVGRYRKSSAIIDIVEDIRKTLKLSENWASKFKSWEDAQANLVRQVEENGIITVFNGVVENNTSRPIPVDDCRGFVLVDDYAPFMFINNADFKSAQMFTIVHELAHIWIGHSAGFDFRKLQPADDPIEILCDNVAAEFLVPKKAFNEVWHAKPNNFKYASRFFKVSEIVVARRALDTGKISRSHYFNFYNEYSNRALIRKDKQGNGGDFYATTRKRLSVAFATHINQAVKNGEMLHRDAYKLTGLKGDTFQNFFSKHL